MDNEKTIEDRLDAIERNISALGASVNSVVDIANFVKDQALGFLNSGAMGNMAKMLGARSDG